jgi:insulysin
MNLCVYSKKPMDELVKFVENLFSLVPKIENFIRPKYDEIMPYDETNLKYFYKIMPIKNVDEIAFEWVLPFCENYYANPLSYLSYVFGHEGPYTLTSSLNRDNLCNTLVSSTSNKSNTFMTFMISISLTKKGLENYREVILRTLKYIKVIQGKKINERYFNDIKSICQIKFDYRNKVLPTNATKGYASLLMNYKPEDVLFAGNIFKEYNEPLIRKYLDLLTLDNLNIYFISNSFEKECNLTEKWFGAKYCKEKINITEEEINSYECGHIFDYPPENKFIPKNFEIIPAENVGKYPEKIMENKNLEVWFLQDKIFNKPKAYLVAEFLIPNDLCNFSDIKNRIISIILEKMIAQELGEWIYMAKEAGVNFNFSINSSKCQIIYSGFNDSLKEGLIEILNIFKNLDLNNQRCIETLEMQSKELLKKSQNIFYEQNYQVNLEYIKTLLNEPAKNPKDLINFLTEYKVSIEDLILFKNTLFKKSKIKWLIQGNITKQTVLEIVNETHKILEIDINEERRGKFVISRPVQFTKNYNYIFRIKSPNKTENNSSLISIYQLGLLNDTEIQYLKIVHSFLQEKFYNQLRTKESLGYIVSLLMSESSHSYCLLGLVQSNTKLPEFSAERVRRFMKEGLQLVKDISDKEFESHVNSRYVLESKKDDNLNECFLRNWGEISDNRNKFDRKEKFCEILKNCTKEEFIKFYEKYFINEVSVLDSEFLCEAHYEENEKMMKEMKILEDEKFKKRVICDTIDDFKACNTLFPIYNNSLYMSINNQN